MRQPLFEYRHSLAGFETRVLELEGDGPPLVFFHGWSDSADTWRPVMALLGRAGRRALAFDMPGYGTASQLQRGAILPQLDRFADAALEYARRAGDGPAYAIGNSLGGCVSLRLAQRHGLDELAGIVPIAPAGLDMATWISAVEGAPLLQALLASPVPLPPQVTRQIVGRLYRLLAFADPSRADPNAVSMFTQHLVERDVLTRLLANARRLRPELRAPFELARIRCPVLLIWGRRDRMVMASGAARVLEALPETRVELIDGCGHCPQVELPDRVARLLLEFAPLPLAAAA